MKPRVNPQAVLLFLTGMLFTAGIFFIGFRTNRQILSATAELEDYEKQLNTFQQSLNDAHTSYANAIQSEKDMINWRNRKAAGVFVPSQESQEEDSSESKTSVFSQNTSPEYNAFADDSSDSDLSSEQPADEGTDSSAEDIFSDQPVA